MDVNLLLNPDDHANGDVSSKVITHKASISESDLDVLSASRILMNMASAFHRTSTSNPILRNSRYSTSLILDPVDVHTPSLPVRLPFPVFRKQLCENTEFEKLTNNNSLEKATASPVSLEYISNEEIKSKIFKFQINPEFQSVIEINYREIQNADLTIDIKEFPELKTKVCKNFFRESSNKRYFNSNKSNLFIVSLSPLLGCSEKTVFLRDLTVLSGSVSHIIYEKSDGFNIAGPTIPQWYRFEIDDDGNKKYPPGDAICLFCRKITCFRFNDYISHLGLIHGVLIKDMIPEGINYGIYYKHNEDCNKLKRGDCCKTFPAIQCPRCAKIIYLNSTNRILDYFRHFIKSHQQKLNIETTNQEIIIPLNQVFNKIN